MGYLSRAWQQVKQFILTEFLGHHGNNMKNDFLGGDPKPLYFLDAFQRGFLCEFQHQILYAYMDHFPNGYVENGWLADG